MAAVREPGRLGEIADLIHDCLFELSAVRFDPESAELTIPFGRPDHAKELVQTRSPFRGRSRRVRVPLKRCLLTIHHVTGHRVRDDAKIETQELNDVLYDPATSRVLVRAHVPVEIEADVLALEVRVTETDDYLGARTIRWRAFGLIEESRGAIEPID